MVLLVVRWLMITLSLYSISTSRNNCRSVEALSLAFSQMNTPLSYRSSPSLPPWIARLFMRKWMCYRAPPFNKLSLSMQTQCTSSCSMQPHLVRSLPPRFFPTTNPIKVKSSNAFSRFSNNRIPLSLLFRVFFFKAPSFLLAFVLCLHRFILLFLSLHSLIKNLYGVKLVFRLVASS